MIRQDFRTALCILRSIDCWEMEEAGVFAGDAERDRLWPVFRVNPYETFISLPDAQAEKIWSVVERRMLPSGPRAMKALGAE